MMNSFIKITAAAVIGLFLLHSTAHAEEVLWESGLNLYIKIVDQERPRGVDVQPNQHPVTLGSEEITNALNFIEAWERGGMFGQDQVLEVFATQQTRLLGLHLASGLAMAEPNQEIEFAIARTRGSFYRLTTYTAGRAFYANDRLNIIFGDYNREPDRFREHTHRSTGVTETRYFFNTGSRARASRAFDHSVVTGNGIDVYQDDQGVRRNDWLLIDVNQAARAYAARQLQRDDSDTAETRRLRQDATRMQREQREMRAEMARMRQDIREMGEGGGSRSSSTQTVEERLAVLDQLREQNLITDDEYQTRRREILSDI